MPRHKESAFWQRALAAVLIAVLLLNLTLLYRQFFGRQTLPKVGGFAFTVVLTGSMLPVISPGDLLVIRERPAYHENDIITYDWGRSLVTHRIVGVEDGYFRTKGDSNNVADAKLVAPAQVHGRVVARIPGVGRLFLFLRSPLGILILVIAGILIIELPYLKPRHHDE